VCKIIISIIIITLQKSVRSCIADEKKLQEIIDETKASEVRKYDELIATNRDQISQLQCDNESLRRVRYVLLVNTHFTDTDNIHVLCVSHTAHVIAIGWTSVCLSVRHMLV